MSMKHFTEYATRRRNPKPVQPMPIVPAKKVQSRPAHAIAHTNSITLLGKDHANFTLRQRWQGDSILEILTRAKAQNIRTPNIDAVCSVASKFHKTRYPATAPIKELRKVFRLLIKHGYIKKE